MEHTNRPTRRPLAATAVLIAIVALALAACAPGADLEVRVGVGASATVEITPVLRAGILVISIPAQRPGDGVAVRADGRTFRIPPGHYPPPGQCRIWNPNRPPGLQSPPGPCERLERQVPRGSYLVVG
jgi:hypothetical protein